MVGSLFLRTYERSERVYQAMLARGFDGELRVLPRPALDIRVWAATLAFVAALAGVETIAAIRW
jgi:cobalt/nickel transport system permease protein